MAKKQTRRSISVSRTTYERLKAFCEANNVSMSQLVETRVNDFLASEPAPAPAAARPMSPAGPTRVSLASVTPVGHASGGSGTAPAAPERPAPVVPMTSAAARFAVEPPPPIIKPRQQEAAPRPAEKRPEQIFTF